MIQCYIWQKQWPNDLMSWLSNLPVNNIKSIRLFKYWKLKQRFKIIAQLYLSHSINCKTLFIMKEPQLIPIIIKHQKNRKKPTPTSPPQPLLDWYKIQSITLSVWQTFYLLFSKTSSLQLFSLLNKCSSCIRFILVVATVTILWSSFWQRSIIWRISEPFIDWIVLLLVYLCLEEIQEKLERWNNRYAIDKSSRNMSAG